MIGGLDREESTEGLLEVCELAHLDGLLIDALASDLNVLIQVEVVDCDGLDQRSCTDAVPILFLLLMRLLARLRVILRHGEPHQTRIMFVLLTAGTHRSATIPSFLPIIDEPLSLFQILLLDYGIERVLIKEIVDFELRHCDPNGLGLDGIDFEY